VEQKVKITQRSGISSHSIAELHLRDKPSFNWRTERLNFKNNFYLYCNYSLGNEKTLKSGLGIEIT
jgi:hypothetical protein